jgi:hypothetical protein
MCEGAQVAYTKSIDVYSFGVMLWAVIAQAKPYSSEKFKRMGIWTLRSEIVGGTRPDITGANFPLAATAPWAVMQLVTECWNADPAKRPADFSDVIERLEASLAALEASGGAAKRRLGRIASAKKTHATVEAQSDDAVVHVVEVAAFPKRNPMHDESETVPMHNESVTAPMHNESEAAQMKQQQTKYLEMGLDRVGEARALSTSPSFASKKGGRKGTSTAAATDEEPTSNGGLQQAFDVDSSLIVGVPTETKPAPWKAKRASMAVKKPGGAVVAHGNAHAVV